MGLDIDSIVSAVRDVSAPDGSAVVLHEPEFTGREWDYVKECIDTGWVSSVGKYVDEFERRVAAAGGTAFAVATVNGTTALHVAFLLAGVKAGDEVIVPALTFVATANAVSHAGAVPHFADSEFRTLGLDPDALARHLARVGVRRDGACFNRETGRRIAAIAPMHTFGHPVDMDRLAPVAAEWLIPVVEDATEALGSTYKGKAAGSLSRIGTLSFNGNKIVTTGGGGAILTDDPDVAKRAKHLTTTAKVPHRWEFNHDEIGFNYRLPNLNAALGCAQFERLDQFLEEKRALAAAYAQRFETVSGGSIFVEPDFARSNYWLNAFLLDEDLAGHRDAVLAATNAAGLMTRPCWTLMHHLPMYAANPRMDLPVAESIARRLINLPSSPKLARHA